MKKNIINVYDNFLDFKLPIHILDIIDDMMAYNEYKPTYTRYFSGLELYKNELSQETARIKEKKEDVITQIKLLNHNLLIKYLFYFTYRESNLVNYLINNKLFNIII